MRARPILIPSRQSSARTRTRCPDRSKYSTETRHKQLSPRFAQHGTTLALAGGAHRAREIEVWMLGRRSYARVAIVDGAEGVLRLTRDVVLSERRQGEWIAMSREPGVLGETVVVALLEDGVTHVATVVESRPIVTDGAVRHRLWLRRVDEHDGGASYWERRR